MAGHVTEVAAGLFGPLENRVQMLSSLWPMNLGRDGLAFELGDLRGPYENGFKPAVALPTAEGGVFAPCPPSWLFSVYL